MRVRESIRCIAHTEVTDEETGKVRLEPTHGDDGVVFTVERWWQNFNTEKEEIEDDWCQEEIKRFVRDNRCHAFGKRYAAGLKLPFDGF